MGAKRKTTPKNRKSKIENLDLRFCRAVFVEGFLCHLDKPFEHPDEDSKTALSALHFTKRMMRNTFSRMGDTSRSQFARLFSTFVPTSYQTAAGGTPNLVLPQINSNMATLKETMQEAQHELATKQLQKGRNLPFLFKLILPSNSDLEFCAFG